MNHVILPVGYNSVIELNKYFSSMLPKPFTAQVTPTSCLTPDTYEVGLCDDVSSYHIPSKWNSKGYVAPEFSITRFKTDKGEFMRVNTRCVNPRSMRHMLRDYIFNGTNYQQFFYEDWIEYHDDGLDEEYLDSLLHKGTGLCNGPLDTLAKTTCVNIPIGTTGVTNHNDRFYVDALNNAGKTFLNELETIPREERMNNPVGIPMKPAKNRRADILYGDHEIFSAPSDMVPKDYRDLMVDPTITPEMLDQFQRQRKLETMLPTDVNGNQPDWSFGSSVDPTHISFNINEDYSFRMTPGMIFEDACKDLKKLSEDYLITDLEGRRFDYGKISELVSKKGDVLSLCIASHGVIITIAYSEETLAPMVIHYKPVELGSEPEVDSLLNSNQLGSNPKKAMFGIVRHVLSDYTPEKSVKWVKDKIISQSCKDELDELHRAGTATAHLKMRDVLQRELSKHSEPHSFSIRGTGEVKNGEVTSFGNIVGFNVVRERQDPVHTWTEQMTPTHHLMGTIADIVRENVVGDEGLQKKLVDMIRAKSFKMLQESNFEKAVMFSDYPTKPFMLNPDGSVMTTEQMRELVGKVRAITDANNYSLDFISKDDLPEGKLKITDECHEELSPTFSWNQPVEPEDKLVDNLIGLIKADSTMDRNVMPMVFEDPFFAQGIHYPDVKSLSDGSYSMDELKESCDLGKVYRQNGVKITSAEIFNEVFLGNALTVNDAHKGVKASLIKAPENGEVIIVKVSRFDNGL